MFQLMFAVITAALISGAIADRMRFGAWVLFAGAVGHLRLLPGGALGVLLRRLRRRRIGGWIANDAQVLDFAGGTAVHINAGVAALALCLVLGKRRGWPREPMRPHNLPARDARRRPAVVRLVRVQRRFGAGRQRRRRRTPSSTRWSPTAAAMLAWLLVERIRDGRPTTPRRRLGMRRRPGRDHPGLSSGRRRSARSRSASIAGVGVRARRRPEVPASATTTRSTWSACTCVGGLVGTLLIGLFATRQQPGRRGRAVLRRRARPAVAPGGRRVRRAGLLVRR